MSVTTFNLSSYINGLATDLTVVPKFQDAAASYGVKRTDTQEIIVASGTAWNRLAPGSYQYELTDPEDGLDYDYVLRIEYPGNVSPVYYPRVSPQGIVNHLYTIPNSTHYSSEAEVLRMLGPVAADLMTEDWESTDTSPVWNDILSYVDDTIDQYLMQKFTRAAIISNSYIRRRATVLSCAMLSQRRGNPGLYMREQERVLEEFNDILTGKLMVPGSIPFARSAPVIRNYLMQPTFYHPQRVISSKSTGGDYNGKTIAWEPYMWVF